MARSVATAGIVLLGYGACRGPEDGAVGEGGSSSTGTPAMTASSGLTTTSGVSEGATTDSTSGGSSETGEPTDEEPPTCLSPNAANTMGTTTLSDGAYEATVSVDDEGACHRVYTLATTQPLRDDMPSNPRTVAELPDYGTLRTGNLMLDALYALTLEEVRECSVDAIHDYAFNNGAAVGCGVGGCFETGRLWNYVWTRDTAYAVDLGLASVDPVRSRNSLLFKLSELREGGGTQIVQDTGSGGSYPVSSDRVAWAVGAWELFMHLEGEPRAEFAARAFEAISNTLEHDRAVVWDESDGLYFGEQSFLDWREQSYPEWTATDVVHIGMSKALSTNLLHLRAHEIAAALAVELGDATAQARYEGRAQALRQAIRERLWLPEEGLFSTFTTTGLDPAPTRRYDLLGSAFAVIFGVADEAQAASIMSRYPHYGPGAPVLWPQQQDTAIYHNRGEWPFVSAYWLRAAKVADNDAVADRMVRSLMRGAALNLSNMENFEAATGAPMLEDGNVSGPVVNSQRQLWSVAAFVSTVHHTLFGLEATAQGLAIRPYITRGLRNDLFAGTNELVLNEYAYRGHKVSVVLHLPPTGGRGGHYAVGDIELDGTKISGDVVTPDLLRDHSRIDVHLLDEGEREPAAITVRSTDDWRDIFAPRTPRITAIAASNGALRLDLSTQGEAAGDVYFAVYRDGVRVADELPGTTTTWTDPSSSATAAESPCYALEACFTSSGNCSQHSPPVCWFGDANGSAVLEFGASQLSNYGGTASSNHGRFHYENWGDDGHELELSNFTVTRTGPHWVQLVYGNGAGAINTGITCAVKRVVVVDVGNGQTVGDGTIFMPHLGVWDRWADSSLMPVQLQAGRTYSLVIRSDDQAINMSSFAHFAAYTGGLGGVDGAYNRVNIAAVKLLPR